MEDARSSETVLLDRLIAAFLKLSSTASAERVAAWGECRRVIAERQKLRLHPQEAAFLATYKSLKGKGLL